MPNTSSWKKSNVCYHLQTKCQLFLPCRELSGLPLQGLSLGSLSWTCLPWLQSPGSWPPRGREPNTALVWLLRCLPKRSARQQPLLLFLQPRAVMEVLVFWGWAVSVSSLTSWGQNTRCDPSILLVQTEGGIDGWILFSANGLWFIDTVHFSP